MKTLLVVRHAKAEIGFGLRDFDRSLTDRGLNDAPIMAEKISAKKINIDLFISSSAKRTKQTARLLCKALHKEEAGIIMLNDLYQAPASAFYEVVQQIDDAISTAAIFGHNPGITNFVNSLVQEINIDGMPTCSVFAVKTDIKSWTEFATAEKEFLFFDYPKNV